MFILYCMYPTLVATITTLFDCTDRIQGVSYLVADLTVKCYEGMHLLFVVFAIVGAIFYAIGIPIAIFFATAIRSDCTCTDWKPHLKCARRDSEEYKKLSMRSRFSFLYHGYATDRSALVVSWEALVMLRKLAVTLAGSVLSDAYLQILAALLILVISCVATAYVQPYERAWLNLLDTMGLLALIATQILSILYFYAMNAEYPIIDATILESATTSLLFALNVTVVAVFLYFLAVEALQLRQKWHQNRSSLVKVARPKETRAAITLARNSGEDEDGVEQQAPVHYWTHPSLIAVEKFPMQINIGAWVWHDGKNALAIDFSDPELLIPVDGVDALCAGDDYR